MDLQTILGLVAGIVGTWLGAELLVRGSARLALRLGVRPLVVGLTVVALGTSSPEAVVSFVAASRDAAGIALGNVLGSNIANVGLILGFIAMLHPIPVRWKEVRLDYGLMLGSTLLAAVFVHTGALNPAAGALFLLLLLVVLVYYARSSHRPPHAEREPGVEAALAPSSENAMPAPASSPGSTPLDLAMSVGGLLLLVGGAHLLVGAAESIARAFGIPDEVIGATMVAVGTSLPELAASVVAVMRGHHEIGIGNILGSNLMNLLFVLGGVCVISPVDPAPDVRQVVLPVMVAFTVLLGPVLARRGKVGRTEGSVLLLGYALFSFYVYY